MFSTYESQIQGAGQTYINRYIWNVIGNTLLPIKHIKKN